MSDYEFLSHNMGQNSNVFFSNMKFTLVKSSSGSVGDDVLSERIYESIIRKITPSQEAVHQSRSQYSMSPRHFYPIGGKIEWCPFMHVPLF